MALSTAPPLVHISPIPRPSGLYAQAGGDGADHGVLSPRTPQRKTPKKNEQETNEDFDRSFQIDADSLTLKQPLNNGEGGIGEVWVGELVDENGSVHDVAVKRYPSAWGPEEMKVRFAQLYALCKATAHVHAFYRCSVERRKCFSLPLCAATMFARCMALLRRKANCAL
jgi:hypothetical protein